MVNRKNVIIGLILLLVISIGYFLYDNLYLKKYKDYPEYKNLIKDSKDVIVNELNSITLEGKNLGKYYNEKNIEIKDVKETIDGKYKKFKGTFILSSEEFIIEDTITIFYRSNGRRYVFDRAYFEKQDRKIYISKCESENIDDILKEVSKSDYDNYKLENVEIIKKDNYKEYEYACEYMFNSLAKQMGNKTFNEKIKVVKYISCDVDSKCKYKVGRV